MRKPLVSFVSGGLLLASILAGAAAADTVDRTPTTSIQLSGGFDPLGVAKDAAGYLYVSRSNNSVEIYAPGAHGDDAPVRILAGGETGISSPRQLAVDDTGRLAVTNTGGGYVQIYAAGAGGDVSPVQAVNGLDFPIGVAFDSAHRIYVTSYGSNSISVFAAAAGNGDAPERLIKGPGTGLNGPKGLTVGPKGQIYVANGPGRSITEFAPGADGNATPVRTLTNADGVIQPESVAVDSSGNIYVTNYEGGVAVFASDATGADAPIRMLVGESTGLGSSWGLALDAQRTVTIANAGPQTVTTYAALVPFTVPGKVRSLEVKGSAADKERLVDWGPPGDDGGAPVTAYRYVVTKNGKPVLKGATGASKVTLRRADLPRGLLTVTVWARNSEGLGGAAARGFRVRK